MTDQSRHSCWRAGLLCALALTLFATAGCSNRRSEQYRGEGDTLLKLGRVEEARTAYRNAEGANPENAMAQLGLARCAAALDEPEVAFAQYERARMLDPSLEASYEEPVRMHVEAGRMDDAMVIAEDYVQESPEAGGLLLSSVLLKSGRTNEAIAQLEELHAAYPESSEVRLNLGVAYAEADRTEESIALLKALSREDSSVAQAAQLALIELFQEAGMTGDLVAEFEQLAEAQPDNLDVQTAYARALVLDGQYEAADAIAREVLASDPDSGWANYAAGARKVQEGRLEEAEAFLEEAAAALPEEERIAALLARAKSGEAPEERGESGAPQAGSTAEVTWRDLWNQAALNRLLSNRDRYLADGDTTVRETLALAALFMRNTALAQSLAEELPQASKVAGYFEALQTRDAQQIADYFEEWRPEAAHQQLLRDNALGYAMAAGGSRGKALSVYLYCLERWPENAVPLLNMAQVFRAIGQPVVAAQQLQRIIVKYPENIDAHQMLYAALREGGAVDEARQAAEASFTLFSEEQWSFLNLGQAYMDTGDLEMARQVMERAQSRFPNNPEIGLAYGSVLVRMGDCDSAHDTLDAIVTTAPPIMATRARLRALCDALAGDWAAVAETARQVEPAERGDSFAMLASVAFQQEGDEDAARNALRDPDSGGVLGGTAGRMLAAALGVNGGELNEEQAAWAETLAADPELRRHYTVLAALEQARLFDAGWDYYSTHLAEGPAHIALAQLAYACMARGDAVDDIRTQGTAIAERLADDARAWLGLAAMLDDAGDEEGQAEALDRAIEAGPDNPEVWFRHAMLMEQRGDYAASAESYRKLLDLQPESAAGNNNLAYMLLQSGGDNEEALERATAAHELMPASAGVLHTLGLAQMRAGDLEASRKTLERATEINPANPTIMFDYGRVLHESGNNDEARQRLRFALGLSQRAGIDFPEKAEAETLLESME